MSESKHAKVSQIRSSIDKRIESFELDKSHTIRSVLEHPFRKITLNHLVVNGKLVLDSNLVKAKVDVIMEGWTKKHFYEFGVICDHLLGVNASHLSVYMDGSLSSLGTLDMKTGTAVFFKNIGLSLGVEVSGLVSSIMAKLQAVALALECIPFYSSVQIFSDSQSALNAYKLELDLLCSDF
ncbi:hypothetical protein G9A89_005269 [Geosiphon pyriformis]|nr:hypothetical protein G9A89_005269 [Geosiphon pyriformis]